MTLSSEAGTAPRDPRVSGRIAPLGIETRPRLSWDPGTAVQTAYEIQVGTGPGRDDIWASGRVEDPSSVAVPYDGPLASVTEYHWRVRVWDEFGKQSPWSGDATWETGLFDESEWDGARWIGGRTAPDHDWTDFDADIEFEGGPDPVDGLRVLFHAEPIGKTWGEAYEWTLGLAPRLDSALVGSAPAGATAIELADTRGLSAGDRITIGSGEAATTATVLTVGAAAVDCHAIATFGPGIVYLAGDPGIRAGQTIDVGGESVTVVSVTDVQGGMVIAYDPPVAAETGTPLSRNGTATTIDAPLTLAVEAGTPVLGRPRMRLTMSTRHYAGNTGVPDGEPPIEWGANYFDPQSEANPLESGVRRASLGDVDLPPACDLTEDTWRRTHRLSLRVRGNRIETSIDGVPVDRRELAGDEHRSHGSFGFDAGTTVFIRSVRITTSDGGALDVDPRSGANPFESGTPGPRGLAIGDSAAVLPIATPAPLLRTSVRIPEAPVRRARLYVAAAGQYELTLDGRELTVPDPASGRGPVVPRLLPDHTDYEHTILYHAFNVDDLVTPGGDLVIAAELGRGWYGVTTPTEWYWHLAAYHGQPRLRAKLIVEHADGTTTVVTTSDAWETADGPTRFDSVYSGEKYDARVADRLGDWRQGAASDAWTPAPVLARPGAARSGHHGPLPTAEEPEGFIPARLRAAEHEPVVAVEVREPVNVRESFPGSGTWIVDFGPILTGFPRITLRGIHADAEGASIRFRGGNELEGTGTADAPWQVEHENGFHDADLQTHYYTLSAATEQVWTPRLTHWGFRYIEVRNLAAALPDADAAAVREAFAVEVARNGFPRTGSFYSDSPLLERIMANAVQSEQNNMLHKPTDTPSREKNGWSGDAMASTESQLHTWGAGPFLTKYLRDFPDAQAASGQLPMILPAVKGGYGYADTPGWSFCWSAVPSWDAAVFVVPWELYLHSGDPTILAELYPTQRRLMAYYETLFPPEDDYRFEAALGEYSASGDPGSNAVISLQFYVHFADHMGRVGRLLGEPDPERWDALAAELRRAFVKRYWDTGSGSVVGGQVESANVMALEFDLVPGSDLPEDDPRHRKGGTLEQNRASAADAAAESVRAHGYHAQMGVYGARYAFNVLEEFAYTDLLMRSVTVRDAPGFAAQIAEGATSMWEMWESGSRNHHYRSNVATWFYQELAGIAPLAPGYAEVRVRPRIPLGDDYLRSVPASVDDPGERGPLLSAGASVRTPRGAVSSAWQRDASGAVELRVDVPSNTVAEIWCPSADGAAETLEGRAEYLETREFGGVTYRVYRAHRGRVRLHSSIA